MKNQTNTNTHLLTETKTPVKAQRIKLGIDVHADSYRVVRQVDNATPQPAQKFTPKAFLLWAKGQLEQAERVFTCYEAGPFGYGLHRALAALGIQNVVVRPQNWDELGKGVKTDKTDALALTQRLDRYVQGNTKALAVIRVPTVAEEQVRAVSRHREQLRQHRQRMEAQGRSLLLYNGHRITGQWWSARNWPRISTLLDVPLQELLASWRDLILTLTEKLTAATDRVTAQASPAPYGFGALTTQILQNEVGDWNRFDNRRQVASLTGLCPGVRSSGLKHQTGPITKHGNPRLRRVLIELAWRMVRYQPDYPPVRHWRTVLLTGHAGARKKAVVAIARKLAIDQWRLATKRTTAEALHLKMSATL
jgi:transposase